MQTVFQKILTVLLTICAVAFMGLSIAAYYGRPDPISEMLAPELSNYNFASQTSETTTSWTVTQVAGADLNPKQHDNAYKAILDAYKVESRRLNDSATQMSELATQLAERAKIVEAQQTQDIAALAKHTANLQALLAAQDKVHDDRSKALQTLMVDTTEIRDETTSRRQDVTRLQNELEELRTDRFRLEEIRRVLTDRLVRLQLENQSLETRMAQFSPVNQSAPEN